MKRDSKDKNKNKKNIEHRPRRSRGRLVIGVLEVNPRGFGFVSSMGIPDVYIAEDDMDGAIHGDRVKVVVYGGKGKPYGKIRKILSRGTSEIVGLIRRVGNKFHLIPLNRRYNFTLLLDDEGEFEENQVAVAAIERYPYFPNPGVGRVVKVLGSEGDPRVGILALMEEYKISADFPREVVEEAERLSELSTFYCAPGERKDLRKKVALTIDPSDAKDFDDALSIEEVEEGWLVGVHIADVSEYVRPASQIDIEARQRSFSVYLVDRAIPMLPPRLSSDLCSLIEGKDRLCLTVEMVLNHRGELLRYKVIPSVIRVRKRLTYEEAQEVLDGRNTFGEEIDGVLQRLSRVAKKLYSGRKKEGMVEFDFPEAKVVLDEEGRAVDVRVVERIFSYRIVEHFMILANSVIAEYVFNSDIQAIYRVHERPDREKLEQLRRILASMGIEIKRINRSNRTINRLLKRVEGLPFKRLVHTLVLRSLSRARYYPVCLGHFGLALKYYLHFTSPIRRYPDLVVHRIVHELIKEERSLKEPYSFEELKDIASYASIMEEKADELEKTSVKMKIVEYMENKVGECFKGVISWITHRGIFVELDNTVEGFVSKESLDSWGDFYYDEDDFSLKGSKGMVFRLGDMVDVQLVEVDKSANGICFRLI
ncbi:ribonuclease R [Acetomicrobium hydrogeniformans]|uniref:Ribonuclease R n=1 Tax=Acetomicrobium hydrogeniformans ATCC BAA-1850 TaxID=592015 RepID=A0A0T5XC34_9BACT|nr:ribonuclease R [Acetomicrobium hydrogeniformans]KRT35764.1 ribonuclease R [Acetomicrobium hydrogeniformans ATCC BAA-1850]